MKSLIDLVKEAIQNQSDQKIQSTEIFVNQEYANCLLELQQIIE